MVVVDVLLDLVGYGTARVLLPVLSFGTIRVQTMKSPSQTFNWSGFKRLPDGTYLCASDLAGWMGLSVWGVGLIAIFAAI
ncbi:hypothetical protein [Rhodopseudomonas palustris]|uniref:Uncharacterized protein n=1 Tax=Rhodopseudomonas palustris (strain ATCC BAA-98 / CGA009) TaxID=258594 RepID=Q6ND19_RHOPA|nr:hypothetical protein [Rhodopseudomonas palustris]OPF93177.1 hypothetical protein B1S06_12320 [Rhodopseudomonas palustris]PPQ42628.1 hypothetical protein CKO39_15765 [Rhodopseudomonas palustris]QQM01785.1 hypothetical protein I8G32_00303 [Rhodopseudomonas palustris]RJF64588.1 hypothetical protein D4Q71_10620 [Rhodopseudomonas palustris]WAB78004.1 hypothetical protein OR798_01510 [Rhodopseudomonas palustris]